LRKSRKSALRDFGSIIHFTNKLKIPEPLDWLQGVPPISIGLFHFPEMMVPTNDRLNHSRLGRNFITCIAFHCRASPSVPKVSSSKQDEKENNKKAARLSTGGFLS
jgi:hypothetical protein